jgi:hypothetical protein
MRDCCSKLVTTIVACPDDGVDERGNRRHLRIEDRLGHTHRMIRLNIDHAVERGDQRL